MIKIAPAGTEKARTIRVLYALSFPGRVQTRNGRCKYCIRSDISEGDQSGGEGRNPQKRNLTGGPHPAEDNETRLRIECLQSNEDEEGRSASGPSRSFEDRLCTSDLLGEIPEKPEKADKKGRGRCYEAQSDHKRGR
jgi:hypothetical protein